MLYVNQVYNRMCATTGVKNTTCIESQYIDLMSETEIWNAFRKGDEGVFTWLYNTYSNTLFEYGSKLAADKELVSDCLHDFFLYLKEKRGGFGDTDAIKPYLLRSFRRRIFEYIKKKHTQVSIDSMTMQSSEPSIESNKIHKETKAAQLQRLNKALRSLKPAQRDVIYYFFYQGLGYEKIAEIFKFSHVSSARRVMYRSLEQLRNSFQYSS